MMIRTGTTFGRLTVMRRYIAMTEWQKRRRGVWWWCRCQCGKEGAYLGIRLRAGQVVSCGCQRNEMLRKAMRRSKMDTGAEGWGDPVGASARRRGRPPKRREE